MPLERVGDVGIIDENACLDVRMQRLMREIRRSYERSPSVDNEQLRVQCGSTGRPLLSRPTPALDASH